MTSGLVVAVLLLTGLLGVWGVVAAVADRPPPRRFLQGLLGLQLVALGQLAVVGYRLSQGDRPVETGAFAGYSVLSLLMLPGGLALSADEQTRWGSLVLAIACVVLAVVELRMAATWR